MAVKDEESTSEEAQANGDATEDQLQVSRCLEYVENVLPSASMLFESCFLTYHSWIRL